MNVDINKILNLLKKMKYIIRVRKTDNGCIIILPSAKLLQQPARKIELIVCINNDIEKTGFQVVENNENYFVQLNKETLKLGLEFIINKYSEDISYSHELILFENQKGKQVSLLDFLNLFSF